jgi:hypothetical protein
MEPIDRRAARGAFACLTPSPRTLMRGVPADTPAMGGADHVSVRCIEDARKELGTNAYDSSPASDKPRPSQVHREQDGPVTEEGLVVAVELAR